MCRCLLNLFTARAFELGSPQDVSATYDNIVDRGFGRADENEADEKGVAIANKTGYAPNGLVAFLTTLKERNKASTEKRGLFASHPDEVAKEIIAFGAAK